MCCQCSAALTVVIFGRYDESSRIPDGSIQRAGENVMSLVRELASSPLLGDPGAEKHGKVVFFDVLGLFSVVYPERIAVIVNSLVIMASAVSLFFGIARNKKQLGGYARTLLEIYLYIFFLCSLRQTFHLDGPQSTWCDSDLLAGCCLH